MWHSMKEIDWKDFAQQFEEEFGETVIEDGNENNPLDWWLQDVTVEDIVEFCQKYFAS